MVEIHGEVLRRHTESGQVLHHGVQLGKAGVKDLVAALVSAEGLQHGLVAAGDGDELQDLVSLGLRQGRLLYQQGIDLLRADLVQLVHGAHDVAGLLRQAQHGVETVEDLAVVHPDLEALQPQGGEGLVDDGRDLRLVGDGELAVADDVDICLIELPEPAPLGPLAPVDLADLIAAEGEGEVIVVQGHVLGQGDCQVEAEGQVRVALLEAVDLLFRLAAALGQQDLAGFDDGGVQRREAVEGVGAAEDLHDALHLLLGRGEQLHKAGQRPGGHFSHSGSSPFLVWGWGKKNAPVPQLWDESDSRFVVPPKFRAYAPFGLLLRGGRRGRFRPRSAAVLPPGRTGRFQRVRPSLWIGCRATAAASARYCDCMRFLGKSQAIGRVEGLTMQRQSRSPRARPSTSISAVAMLLAKGMLFWSHRREM